MKKLLNIKELCFKSMMSVILLTVGAPAEAKKVGDCEDKAYFSFFVNEAKEKGVPREVFLNSLKEVVVDHPELGLTEQAIQEMVVLTQIVYGTQDWDVGKFYTACMSHLGDI